MCHLYVIHVITNVWRILLPNINSDYIIVMGLQVILNGLFIFILHISSLKNSYYMHNKESPNGKICGKRREFCSLLMS